MLNSNGKQIFIYPKEKRWIVSKGEDYKDGALDSTPLANNKDIMTMKVDMVARTHFTKKFKQM